MIASVLARAFIEDPVARFIFPRDAGREGDLRRFFLLQVRHNYLGRGEVWTAQDGVGAALWMPPEVRPPQLSEVLAHLALVGLLRGRFLPTRRLAQLLAGRRPRERHYYLGTIGTDPSTRRQGVGSDLMAPVLRQCDASSTAAYLECSRLENVPFYEAHGFAVLEEVPTGKGGPSLWLMWRAPTSPCNAGEVFQSLDVGS